MKTTIEPMLGFGFGGGGLILMLSLLVFLAVAAAIVALVFLLIRVLRKPVTKDEPLPPVHNPPVATKTHVMNRACQKCGSPLPPDAPEGLCPACLLQQGFATEGGAPPGTPPFVPPTMSELAQFFPQLEILELVGKGGMGAVYKARQPALDRFVALKILAPRSGGDVDFAGRFNREARALARLSHPNIVGVYDFGQTAHLSYFIMEYVDGPNLRQAGKLSPRQAMEIIPQICAALQFAHDEGIVHRDIKPENVMLDRKGRVKIADFGLAKILGQDAQSSRLTGARDIMGTPHYMAPEQVERPQDVDHRADIYSLGVVFYEMLTGELPLGKFQSPSQKVAVDVRLDEVVLRSLAKEPELRYQHVSELGTRVETIAHTNAESAAATPNVSADEILLRDYKLNIRHCLSRGWALVKNDFWPLVGMSAFVLVVLSAISSSDTVLSAGKSTGKTSILGILLSGPLLGGLYFYFLKKIRRENAGVEAAFAGFRQALPHLVIAGFLATLLTTLGFFCLVLPGIYLFVAWILTFPLIIERRLDFWPGLQLSRKIVNKHWWKFLGFLIVLGLINLAGIAMFCVGFFITFPITVAAFMYAYEDVTGGMAISSTTSSANAFKTSQQSSPDRFWKRFAVVIACVILIPVAVAIIGILAAIAIPAFVRGRDRAKEVHRQDTTRRLSPRDGLLARWSAEGDARDSVSHRDGLLIGNVRFGKGIIGQAFKFDGERSYVKIPIPARINVDKAITVEFWMKADDDNEMQTYQGLVASDFYGIEIANGWALAPMGLNFWISTDNGATISPWSFPDTATVNNGGPRVSAGQWHHVAGTYNGTNLQLYVDGERAVQSCFHSGKISPMRAASFITIGSEDGRTIDPQVIGTRYFKGMIDEIGIYNRALTPEEIVRIFVAGVSLNPSGDEPKPKSKRSDHIGKTWFPRGDSITITSVERSSESLVVKGRYNLVSTNRAELTLNIATTNTESTAINPSQSLPVSGRGNFELVHPNPATGLPHVSMYADGESFADVYFGTEAEAREERLLDLSQWPASKETWTPAFAEGEKRDYQKIVEEAKQLMERGSYEEALQRQVWFHNHAAESGDSYIKVVRLTSALSQWEELGRRYPKAKRALIEIRNRHTQQLAAGDGYCEMLEEVHAINHELGDDDATYALLKKLQSRDPKVVSQCYYYMESLLVSKGEYRWCLDQMGDPQGRFDLIRRTFEMDRDREKKSAEMRQRMAVEFQKRGMTNLPAPVDTSAMMKKSDEDRFVGSVRQLIEILIGTNRKDDAENIRDQALGLLDDPRLKSAIADAEEKTARRPM